MNAAFRGWSPRAGPIVMWSISAVPPAVPTRLVPTVPPDSWARHLSQCGPHCHSEKFLLYTFAFYRTSVTLNCLVSTGCSLPKVHFTERRGEGGSGAQGQVQRGSPGLTDGDVKQEAFEGVNVLVKSKVCVAQGEDLILGLFLLLLKISILVCSGLTLSPLREGHQWAKEGTNR